MIIFKVNCTRTIGNADSYHTHVVVASDEKSAVTAVVADANNDGATCAAWMVSPLYADGVLVGS